MSETELPLFFIPPFLKIGRGPAAAAEARDDPSSNSGLLTTDSCTCGTVDKAEIIDILPDHHFGLPGALRSVKPCLTIVIVYNFPYAGLQWQKMDECPLCSVIFMYSSLNSYLPRGLTRSIESTFLDFWSKHSACARVKEIYLKIDSTESRTRVYGCFTNHASIYELRTVSEFCDFAIMKFWIHNCKTKHPQCIKQDQVVEGMRLIDCQQEKVCEAEPHVRWVTLSYVWGGSSCTKPQHSDSLANASQTIKDAMFVAVELGYRYLWVDAYCINQAHGAHKADQISKMDKIYRGSDLTIVALGPDQKSGLHGISHERKSGQKHFRMQERKVIFAGEDPFEVVRSSVWWSRGWTFQEGYLSRRLLIFGKEQVTFCCKTNSWVEFLNGPETVKEQTDVDWNTWNKGASLYEDKIEEITPLDSNRKFTNLVEKYTERTLTFESDILNAFTGIARQLSTSDPPMYNFAGLPYVPWVDAGSREELINLALAFVVLVEDGVPERRPGFPSWTWAGWKGSAYWSHAWELDDLVFATNNIRFESADPLGHEESITSELTQSFLNSVVAISFDARLVPMEYIAFDEDWVHRYDRLFVGNSRLVQWYDPSVSTVAEKFEKGLWSCVILASIVPHQSSSLHDVFVYIIEWQDRTTATRLGVTTRYVELSLLQKLQKVEQRTVRLV